MPAPLLAYIRRYQEDWALIVIPLIRKEVTVPELFSISLPEGAPSGWINIFTEEQVRCRNGAGSGNKQDNSVSNEKKVDSNILELNGGLSQFPVAMLVAKK